MNRIIACLVALMCAGAAGPASSQAYPSKPIRIVAPFASAA